MTLTLSMAETLDALINNSLQETDYSEEEDNNNNIDLSLLRINSFGNSSSDRRRANSSPPQFQSHGSFGSSSTTAAAAAATSPVKRPSPESKETDEPRRKKLFLPPPPPPEPEDDETMSYRMGYSKIPLPADSNPTRVRPSPIYRRSLSDTFASSRSRETAPSLPPRPPVFRRCVSDLSPAASKAFRGGPSRSTAIEETSEANKMLYAIKNGVVELDQWCNKLLQYGESVSSSVKQDDTDPKEGVRELDQWCNKLIKYGEADDSPKEEVELPEEEQEKECKEGVKVDRVGEAFVVEINCPCGRNYRTLFSGRDCYYKLL